MRHLEALLKSFASYQDDGEGTDAEDAEPTDTKDGLHSRGAAGASGRSGGPGLASSSYPSTAENILRPTAPSFVRNTLPLAYEAQGEAEERGNQQLDDSTFIITLTSEHHDEAPGFNENYLDVNMGRTIRFQAPGTNLDLLPDRDGRHSASVASMSEGGWDTDSTLA